jgi:hypothetical protein
MRCRSHTAQQGPNPETNPWGRPNNAHPVGMWHVSLEHLDLGECSKVTDVGLRHLSGLNQLTRLTLDYCYTFQSAEEELCRQIPCLHYDE